MRRTAMAVVTLLTVGLLYPVVAAAPAGAVLPTNVNVTLEGCKLGTIDPVSVTCDDGDYTTGNLGKNWNELDLVPYRLTLDAGSNAPNTQTYSLAVALDASDAGHPGYYVISAPVINTALSNASCQMTVGSEQIKSPGVGGIDETRYRIITVTQAKGDTCVLDFYGGLAIGSHLFPGSSLHANALNENLGTAGVGARDVSIPVKEIEPQELSKTMTASQADSNVNWTIFKEPSDATREFGNICDANAPTSLPLTYTITWTRTPDTPGNVTVTTIVTATNPAHRDITVHVTDVIKSGGTTLDTANNNPGVNVAAGTSAPVLTHTIEISAAQAVNLNDVATATYTDTLTGLQVPGQLTTTAQATVQPGSTTNSTATITDVETLTGGAFAYSLDDITGDVDALNGDDLNGYTLGTQTTDPVTWDSGTLSAGGSVTFHKTVYFDGSGAATGNLNNVATLTASEGFTASSSADVSLSSTKSATLTINKSTTVPVDGDTDFVFNVTGGNLPVGGTDVTITILDGELFGTADLSGLADGDYTITETNAGGFTPVDPIPFTVGPDDCAIVVPIENTFSPATAKVQKVTVPNTASLAGFEFTLFADDDGTPGPSAGDTMYAGPVTTDATGLINFGAIADEGDYYVLETDSPDGFISNGGDIGCTFTVNYPANADNTFTCTWTNTAEATATVAKVTDPPGNEGGWEFPLFKDVAPAGPGPEDAPALATVTTTDASAVDFGVTLDEGDYYILETSKPGWENTGSTGCEFTVTFPDDAGQPFACTFTNTATGTISVDKSGGGAGQEFTFELRELSDDNDPANPADDTVGQIIDTVQVASGGGPVQLDGDLAIGTYTVCEFVMPGWSTDLPNQYTLVLADNNVRVCTDVTITVANQDIVLNVNNTPPPGGEQRTIGFWKNWSSCDGKGNQDPVLDETLTAAGGSILVGTLTVDTCQKAIKILNKSTLSGQKKASDPGFNLAAQYLAARLNQAAGAEDSCITQTLADAQAALASYGFDGTKVMTKAQIKSLGPTFNALATTLDQYNNGLIC